MAIKKTTEWIIDAVIKTRKKLKWSQEKLADHFGISQNYISLIEKKRRIPPKKLLEKLALFVLEELEL